MTTLTAPLQGSWTYPRPWPPATVNHQQLQGGRRADEPQDLHSPLLGAQQSRRRELQQHTRWGLPEAPSCLSRLPLRTTFYFPKETATVPPQRATITTHDPLRAGLFRFQKGRKKQASEQTREHSPHHGILTRKQKSATCYTNSQSKAIFTEHCFTKSQSMLTLKALNLVMLSSTWQCSNILLNNNEFTSLPNTRTQFLYQISIHLLKIRTAKVKKKTKLLLSMAGKNTTVHHQLSRRVSLLVVASCDIIILLPAAESLHLACVSSNTTRSGSAESSTPAPVYESTQPNQDTNQLNTPFNKLKYLWDIQGRNRLTCPLV